MNNQIKNKMIEICDKKISLKGKDVGLSFYAFFSNKNDNPTLLMEVAEWWIMENKLDHFEKAQKIKKMLKKL
ncbi:Msl2237 protein [hydrothermal vent metagenome]|uniref:Msl2237 protein n=1 Tax=hydrothermal vent metagenome TaxID=652676 RepID=A0A3B0ZBX2_9ZZZZ